MATTSKLTAANGFYGHSGSKEYSTASTNHLYVGKSSGTSDYRSRLSFPALSSLAEVGASRFRIKAMKLYLRRNESGSASTITLGCSSGSSWDAALAATVSASITNKTDGYQIIDLTALAGTVEGYTSKWYLHISGTTPRLRFDGTAKAKKPYLEVTWEFAAATISGNKDAAELGATEVTFTITPEVDGETHTLTYAIGETTGTVGTKAGNSIKWTPPLSLASEITNSDSAVVEVNMTAYDSSGSEQRTEVYYQTVTVPASVKPVITKTGIGSIKSLKGYLLGGCTSLQFKPEIDMNGTYGATIESLTATLSDGQIIQWTSIAEKTDAPGVFTVTAAKTGVLPQCDVKSTITAKVSVTDSRGRETSASTTYAVYPYSPPVITNFEVIRCEPEYDENEEPTGNKVLSDVGTYLAVSLVAEAASLLNSSGSQQNSLSYTITGTNADGTKTLTNANVTGDYIDDSGISVNSGIRIGLVFRDDVFPNEIAEDDAWTFTVTVTDAAGNKAVKYDAVPPGHAALSLSPDKYGVAVGKIAEGTKAKPMFEVAKAYESRFFGPVYDQDNKKIVGCSVTYRPAEFLEGEEIIVPNKTNTDTVIFTAEKAGIYLACISERWQGDSNGYRSIALIDTTLESVHSRVRQAAGGSEEIQQNLCAVIPLAAGASIKRRAYQDSGKALKFTERIYQFARIGGV